MQATYDDVAQAVYDDDPDAVIPAAPSGDVAGSPTSITKEQRDRLAQDGRRLAAAERNAQAALQRAEAAEARATRIDNERQAERERGRQAYLERLDPQARAVAETQMLRSEVADLRRERVASPVQTEDPVAYQQRRTREMLDEARREFGVELTGQEEELDTSSEASFKGSLRALAIAQKKLGPARQEEAMPQVDDQEERLVQRVAQRLGVSRSLTPRSTGPSNAPVTMEDYQQSAWDSVSSRQGPQGNIARTRALREQALRRVPANQR